MPERPVLGAGRRRPVVIAHGSLLGRDEPDQHPVEAIGGLDAWLVGKLIAGSNITLQVDDDWVITISASGGGAVDSVNGETGVVVLDASDVGADPAGTAAGLVDDLSGVTNAATARTNLGLGNVDNTSDANKPVSTAQQTALDGKAAASHSHSGADITSGTVSTARLGTGAANATTFLRGDQTWAAAGGSETLPASIIDAKGDVIVGTAADTAARLAVGADGQVLTADSAETTGVKWAAAAGGGDVATDPIFDAAGDLVVGTGANTAARLPVGSNGQVLTADSTARWGTPSPPSAYSIAMPIVSGRIYSSRRGATGTQSFAADYIRLIPFIPHQTFTADRIVVYTTATAGGLARLGVYDSDGTNGYPATRLLDAGSVATTSTGDQAITISYLFVVGKLYWLAANVNVATSFAQRSVESYDVGVGFETIGWATSYPHAYMASSFGALPSTITSTPWGAAAPFVAVRAS